MSSSSSTAQSLNADSAHTKDDATAAAAVALSSMLTTAPEKPSRKRRRTKPSKRSEDGADAAAESPSTSQSESVGSGGGEGAAAAAAAAPTVVDADAIKPLDASNGGGGVLACVVCRRFPDLPMLLSCGASVCGSCCKSLKNNTTLCAACDLPMRRHIGQPNKMAQDLIHQLMLALVLVRDRKADVQKLLEMKTVHADTTRRYEAAGLCEFTVSDAVQYVSFSGKAKLAATYAAMMDQSPVVIESAIGSNNSQDVVDDVKSMLSHGKATSSKIVLQRNAF